MSQSDQQDYEEISEQEAEEELGDEFSNASTPQSINRQAAAQGWVHVLWAAV